MTLDTNEKIIKCKAAICWAPNKPLTVEHIDVEPPKAGEVRIKVIANSICHSDLHAYTGHFDNSGIHVEFPCILGHEGAGVVESVGEDVTSVVVGDHVVSLFNGECRECAFCKNPKTNLCLKRRFDETRMSDQSTRFTLNGKPVYHFVGISSLSEYTVIAESQVAKINPDARMDRACIFACGFTTGYGSAVHVAQINKDSTVGVWGLGPVGLSAVYGAKVAGAANIIGIDTNEMKLEVAKKLGCNHFINPQQCKSEKKSTVEVIQRLTNGIGLDFAIECAGAIPAFEEAFASLSPWGTLVQVGIAAAGKTVQFSPNDFLAGKKITGAMFGGYKTRDAIPKLVEEYVNGKIDVEDFFTGTIKLDAVDEAFQQLNRGEVLRTVVLF